MIFDKLKALFSRGDMPEEARGLFQQATTTRELLQGLDELLTRNELEFNELNREIAQLEEIEQEEIQKVRGGQLNDRVKQNTLLYIKRLRKQMDNLQNRLYIFDKNINLHLNLIAKIQDMEAMALKGVEEKEIDTIVVEFQTNFEKYMDSVVAAEAAEQYTHSLSPEENVELKKLEEELLVSKEEKAAEIVKEEKALPAQKEPSRTPERLREEVAKELRAEIYTDEEDDIDFDEDDDIENVEEQKKVAEEAPPKRRLLEAD